MPELSPLALMGISSSSPSTMVSNPVDCIGGFGLVVVSVSTVDSRDARCSVVIFAGGNAETVIFEVVGLEEEAVRLNVERGDVGFEVVETEVGCVVFRCVTFEVRKPKRVETEVVLGVDVGIVVGFAGDTDLDDPLDPPDVRVGFEDRGKE